MSKRRRGNPAAFVFSVTRNPEPVRGTHN